MPDVFQDLNQLDTFLATTIDVVEERQRQIFAFAENLRSEIENLKQELLAIQLETMEVMDQLQEYQAQEDSCRKQLLQVTQNLSRYSDDAINEAYECSKDIEVKVALLREREIHLREKQAKREAQLRHFKPVVKRSDDLISHLGVAIDYLSRNQESFCEEVAAVSDKESHVMAVIRAQEEERKRVARDIHDGPAQSVANLILQVEYCQKLLEVDPLQVNEELEVLKTIAKVNLQTIRKIIFALRPMDLDDLGLVPAVKRYLSEFERTSNLPVSFRFIGTEGRYTQAIEVAVFRIVQEALNNVIKHAQASKVEVILETQLDSISAVVRDDGVGFEVGGEVGSDSFGLRGMQERTDLLEGELTVRSLPGQGTEVFVMVPVKGEKW